MSRALKLHHRERIKKNRRFYFGRDLINEPRYIGMAINTPAPCSCLGCGNDRQYEGMTRKEKISVIDKVNYD